MKSLKDTCVAYATICSELFVRKDPETGDVILSRKPPDWDSFFAILKGIKVPPAILGKKERKQAIQKRDPLDGWRE